MCCGEGVNTTTVGWAVGWLASVEVEGVDEEKNRLWLEGTTLRKRAELAAASRSERAHVLSMVVVAVDDRVRLCAPLDLDLDKPTQVGH